MVGYMGRYATYTNDDFKSLELKQAGYSLDQISKMTSTPKTTVKRRIDNLAKKLEGVGKCAEYVKNTYEDSVHAMCGLILESLVDDVASFKEIPADKRVRMLKDLRSTLQAPTQELKSDPVSAFFAAIPVVKEDPKPVDNSPNVPQDNIQLDKA